MKRCSLVHRLKQNWRSRPVLCMIEWTDWQSPCVQWSVCETDVRMRTVWTDPRWCLIMHLYPLLFCTKIGAGTELRSFIFWNLAQRWLFKQVMLIIYEDSRLVKSPVRRYSSNKIWKNVINPKLYVFLLCFVYYVLLWLGKGAGTPYRRVPYRNKKALLVFLNSAHFSVSKRC